MKFLSTIFTFCLLFIFLVACKKEKKETLSFGEANITLYNPDTEEDIRLNLYATGTVSKYQSTIDYYEIEMRDLNSPQAFFMELYQPKYGENISYPPGSDEELKFRAFITYVEDTVHYQTNNTYRMGYGVFDYLGGGEYSPNTTINQNILYWLLHVDYTEVFGHLSSNLVKDTREFDPATDELIQGEFKVLEIKKVEFKVPISGMN